MITYSPNSLTLLPEYQGIEIVARARDYLIAGERYQRVTTALGIINKPALIGWAKTVALAKIRDVLLNEDVRNEIARMGFTETHDAIGDDDYSEWVDRLIQTASDRPDEVRDERAALGTEAHALVRDASLLITPADHASFREMVTPEQLPVYEDRKSVV
mgnify:CR=1 FL=1